jgi:hypothetical protein
VKTLSKSNFTGNNLIFKNIPGEEFFPSFGRSYCEPGSMALLQKCILQQKKSSCP